MSPEPSSLAPPACCLWHASPANCWNATSSSPPAPPPECREGFVDEPSPDQWRSPIAALATVHPSVAAAHRPFDRIDRTEPVGFQPAVASQADSRRSSDDVDLRLLLDGLQSQRPS